MPEGAQFCYRCGAPMVPSAPVAPAAGSPGPASTAAPGWPTPGAAYPQPARVRRRPTGIELAADVLALLGMVVLVVDYWVDWWVLLVIGLFLLVMGLVLYVVAWSQRPRPQPTMAYAPPYQPPAHP